MGLLTIQNPEKLTHKPKASNGLRREIAYICEYDDRYVFTSYVGENHNTATIYRIVVYRQFEYIKDEPNWVKVNIIPTQINKKEVGLRTELDTIKNIYNFRNWIYDWIKALEKVS